MTDIEVRNLDDSVATALRARAEAKGISLEEVRRTLAASVEAGRAKLARGGRARAAAGGQPGTPELDSARIVRAERDAWG